MRNENRKRAVLGAGLIAVTAATAALAGGGPVFRKGMWQSELAVTVNGKTVTMSKTICRDPTQEIALDIAASNVMGCARAPAVKSGNQYRTASRCSGAFTGYKNTVITVAGDSAYTVATDEMLGTLKDHTLTTARRLGDCR